MCEQTSVLLNCVGPFFLYGESVVRHCVNSGTDYLDITGETNFIKEMYTKYNQQAVEKNVLVIPAVAFDSLPGIPPKFPRKNDKFTLNFPPSIETLFFGPPPPKKFFLIVFKLNY
jgi:hypothetical protein